MPVPDYETLMLPLLRALADGAEHPVGTLRNTIASELKLTDQDRAELLPSGKQSVFDNRLGWAKTYLDKAGLVSSVRRGVYRITDQGRAALAEKPESLSKKYLERFESFRAFANSSDVEDAVAAPEPVGAIPLQTPEEALDRAYKEIRRKVEADLLEAVGKASAAFFEKLVVDLLVKMGYGGTVEDAGRALGRSHDGGLDGIIKEDRLGLDIIYVQAKRWDTTVGRPEIQKFAGALEGQRARKGIFLTTSEFSREAEEYVSRIDKKIILIDGITMARHMIDFGVGVSLVSSYEVKKLDLDYFDLA